MSEICQTLKEVLENSQVKKKKKGNCVLLEGHLDTVFSFGDVKEIIEGADGKLHCPGICDDTRAIAANLAVAKALIDSGIKPFYDIVIGATVREEGLGGQHSKLQVLSMLQLER